MAEPIFVARGLSIDPNEISESFVRSSGPGGQNVNKVASAVQLRFDLMASPNLPEPVKRRVAGLAGSRLTKDGVLIIEADEHRSQPLNRTAALERLLALLRAGTVVPKKRVATRPTLASRERRLKGKQQRGAVKKMRRAPPNGD
jgi:ribosome-associated protein